MANGIKMSEDEQPKKIALKVPALFIKGASGASDKGASENGETKKLSRPMPASMRKKLEEAIKSDSNKEENESVDSSKAQENEEPKRPSRPMPASARKRLEEKSEREKDNGSDCSSATSEGKASMERRSKPMPVSAKQHISINRESKASDLVGEERSKSLADAGDSDEKVERSKKPMSKPMPAFAKKKLENEKRIVTSDEDVVSATSLEVAKKPNRPMPASARRKLDERKSIDEIVDISDKSSQSKHDESTPAVEDMGVDGIDEDSNESKRSEEEPPTKKINISLGGITFPTFKKPMPSSVKRKLEETTKESSSNKDGDSTENTLDASRSSTHGRSRRRDGSSQGLMELTDPTYPCDVCGTVFYTAGNINKHKKNRIVVDGRCEPKEPKEKTKKEYKKKKKSAYPAKRPRSKAHLQYKDIKECPHCQMQIGNPKKMAKHVSICRRPDINCPECDKTFKISWKLEAHRKVHIQKETESSRSDEAIPIPLSANEFNDDSVPSPMSVESKDSSKTSSVVDKPKAMPKSMKAKLMKEEGVKVSSNPETARITGVQMFKRKIANVLSTLGARRLQTSGPQDGEEDTADVKSPPTKRTKHESGESESIQGHPMPASVRKKLQDRESQDTPADTDDNSSLPLSLSECAVCHKTFSSSHSRLRHEQNVHKIKNPRKQPVGPKLASSSKSKVSAVKVESEIEKSAEPISAGLTLENIPVKKGNCPICGKFISRVRQHVRKVHKYKSANIGSTSGIKGLPVAHSKASKSYKIYRTATNKLKQKLTSTATKKISEPLVVLPKVSIEAIAEVEAPTERKVSASTASSDLRCACCDKIFEVTCDFYEHMAMHEPKLKRLITCKICDHKFSHEEDFLLHMQFRHKDLLGEMKEKAGKSSRPKVLPESSSSNITTESRRTRTSLRQHSNASEKPTLKGFNVKISKEDKELAENFMKKWKGKLGPTPSSSRSTRRTSVFRATTPDSPAVMDDVSDHFEDTAPMDEDDDQSQIVITSISSQKSSGTPIENAESNDLDPMQCSSCSDVFYSFEALKKHELYFHNVKNSNMCPICGVYPTRLSRHLIAHENKTVRRTCVPCQLNFPSFTEMRLHNIKMHPETSTDASIVSKSPHPIANKANSANNSQQNTEGTVYRCRICSRDFTGLRGRANAVRHVREVHSKPKSRAEEQVEEISVGSAVVDKEVEDEDVEDKEVEDILKDTNQKLLDPDWDENVDDDPLPMISTARGADVPQASLFPSVQVQKSRPMPASARAKLQSQLDQLSVVSKTSSDSSEKAKGPPRAMPASVRAKLEALKQRTSTSNDQEEDPAREKVVADPKNISASNTPTNGFTSTSTAKPARPMPASVRAKLQNNSQEPPSRESARPSKVEPKSPENVITLEDDDDPVDVSMPDPGSQEKQVDESSYTPSIPLFSLSDQIEEHNRAVELAMGSQRQNDDFNLNMFQCKLCSKKFDSLETSRRHIKRIHQVYDFEQTEALIVKLFEDIADTPRRKRANVRYNEDFVDGEDEEVVIRRTSSTRSKPAQDTPWGSTPSFDLTSDSFQLFACKWCGQSKDSACNIKRHIGRAHPQFSNRKDEGVMVFDSEEELQNFKSQLQSTSTNVLPQRTSTSMAPPSGFEGNPIFVCKVCSRCMTNRSSLYMHVLRSHPEVGKGNANSHIQELNGAAQGGVGTNEETSTQDETEDNDSGFYCSICPYKTSDEADYVRHYKGHTGVSPYQCQYCSATFNRQQQLSSHVTREHTGAEFLNLTSGETEVSMDEVLQNEISVAPSSKVQISRSRRSSASSNSSKDDSSSGVSKKYTPGPASRKTAAARKIHPPEHVEPMEVEDVPSDPASPVEPEDDNASVNPQQRLPTSVYQGDLSSLFPTLGGGTAPGGIEALDDIDGGMCLD